MKNVRVEKAGKVLPNSRVFTFGEDSRTLRLPSELGDLRTGYANLQLLRNQGELEYLIIKTKERRCLSFVFMVEMTRFELATSTSRT